MRLFTFKEITNLKKVIYSILLTSIIIGFSFAQQAPTIELIEDHNSWGWDAWVMQNDLITIATVPVIGARIMQYDLGTHSSIYVNSSELGNTYTPSLAAPARNFGGFKNWPAPQSVWSWPPPPTLDYGSYGSESDTFTDSVSLVVTSPIEQWRAPDIRFQRRTTLYKGTSHVKVEQTIINEGSAAQQWSVWDITQSYTTHTSQTDFENFWVYFPINPDSRYGESGVRIDGASDAWVGEVAPGIYGIQYSPDAAKIFADSHIGWICYVDEKAGYAYAKTFSIFDGADYPDQGACVEVWVNNDPYYLEVEVVSPIVDLPAEGGNYTFTEDWWAAKVDGPILSVTNAGAVKSFGYDFDSERFIGEFGVFHIAQAQLEFRDNLGTVLDTSSTYDVTPLETFVLDDATSVPELADSVFLVLLDGEGEQIGILVSESLENMFTDIEESDYNHPADFVLEQNYPNPFNPKTVIQYTVGAIHESPTYVDLSIYNVLGQKVATLVSQKQQAGNYKVEWDATDFASGVYINKLETSSGYKQSKKLILLK